MKCFLILPILILTAACQRLLHHEISGAESQKIIQGEIENKNNELANSVVAVFVKEINDRGEFYWIQFCSGSVLNRKNILTAAHCIAGRDLNEVVINFSEKSLDNSLQAQPQTRIENIFSNFEIRKIKRYKINPLYDGSARNDVAMIELQDAAPSSAQAVPFLPDRYLDLKNEKTNLETADFNYESLLMGYGWISEFPVVFSDHLRKTNVKSKFEGPYVLTDQTHGSGLCNGDSGGPAFIQLLGTYYLVGVVHDLRGEHRTCDEIGEYINPAFHKDFINSF